MSIADLVGLVLVPTAVITGLLMALHTGRRILREFEVDGSPFGMKALKRPPGPPPAHVFPTSTKHPGRGAPMPIPRMPYVAMTWDPPSLGNTRQGTNSMNTGPLGRTRFDLRDPAQFRQGDSLDVLDLLCNELANPWETVRDSWGFWVDVNLDTGEVRPTTRRMMPATFETIDR